MSKVSRGGYAISNFLFLAILLNFAFVVFEIIAGWRTHALSLLSDAGHNLGDMLGLLLVVAGFRLAEVKPSRFFTFGLKKTTILISLVNALILMVVLCGILVESVLRLQNPSEVNGLSISAVAGIGIVVKAVTALLLYREQQDDLSVRSAFLHTAADVMIALGVVVSGLLIWLTGKSIIDPIVGIVIALILLVPALKLLYESFRLSIDGTPKGIDADEVMQTMMTVPHVVDVHHLHIWALSTKETALMAHVRVDDAACVGEVKHRLQQLLQTKKITHITIDTELNAAECLSPEHQ